MAATLYVVSLEGHSGKTAMCMALGLDFKARGLSVGYMKPLGKVRIAVGEPIYDWDCVLVPQALNLGDPLGAVCPAVATRELSEDLDSEPMTGVVEQVVESHRALRANRDVVILEGSPTLADGYAQGASAPQLASALDAQALLVVRYGDDLSIDEILMARDMLGDRLAGIVMNSVPKDEEAYTKEYLPAYLNRYGLTCFGILPVDKFLTAVSIRHLTSVLHGEVLCGAEKLDELVEDFAIGAMHLDAALKYFVRIHNKVVITGGDRADIQLAALQTSTKALILTGNLRPDALILERAAKIGVPMILVGLDTMRAVELVDREMGRIRLTNQRQLDRLHQLFRREVNVKGICQRLGL
jgi:uncharacterized protein